MTANASVDPQQTKLLQEYKLDRPLTSCHWDPQSRFVFCGAEDFLIHRIDPASGQKISLAAHDSWIRAFGSSLDGDPFGIAEPVRCGSCCMRSLEQYCRPPTLHQYSSCTAFAAN